MAPTRTAARAGPPWGKVIHYFFWCFFFFAPRPFFRSEYGLYFVPRAMLSALLALLLFVARLPARAAARLSSRRGY